MEVKSAIDLRTEEGVAKIARFIHGGARGGARRRAQLLGARLPGHRLRAGLAGRDFALVDGTAIADAFRAQARRCRDAVPS
jgi:hypothetical protein